MNSPTINANPPPELPKTKAAPIAAAVPTAPKSEPRGLAIEVAKIHASPSNPRKRFPSEEKLRELGESMKSKGQLQDVLVRPHPTKKDAFELVFGECRWRAAKLVGLKTLAAKCRDLSDVEVLEIQIIENGQRTDVHELEEAEGYEQLHKKFGYDVDTIAAKVGKSRGYVYARMKLLRLTNDQRESLYEGRLNSSTALYVARVPSAKLQAAAASAVEGLSAREAIEVIQSRFMLKMLDATFDKKDAGLVPAAGACSVCPKRTSNAKDLYPELKTDLCTDPDCFTAKREADWKRRTELAKAAGQEVVAKPVDRKYDYGTGAHVSLDAVCTADPKGRTYRELLKGVKEAPPLAIGRDQSGAVVELAKRDAVTEAIAKKHTFAKTVVADEKKHEKTMREMQDAQAVERKTRELAIAETVKLVERRQPKAAFLVAVIRSFAWSADELLHSALERRGLGTDLDEALAIVKDEATLRGIIAELVCGEPSHVQAEGRAELFEAYGVTEKAFAKQARAELKAEAQRKDKKAS